MKKNILLIFVLISFPFLSFAQFLIDDISDFWPKEMIKDNNIQQVTLIEIYRGSTIYNFRSDGQIEIEYHIRLNGKDTSTVYHYYNDNKVVQILWIGEEGDTLSKRDFIYDRGKLIEEIDKSSAYNSIDITQYFYDKNGLLIEIEEEYSSDDFFIKITKEVDVKGRIKKETFIDSGKDEIESTYTYKDNKVIIKKTENKTVIDLNKNGFPIASRNYQIEGDKEKLESLVQFIYNRSGLLEFIFVDSKSDIKVEYTKWE